MAIPWNNLSTIKAIAILSVILVHIPNICQPVLVLLNVGVPLFLLVQSYIVYAKLESGERSVASYYHLTSFVKIIQRIVLPWIVMVAIEFCVGVRLSRGLSGLLQLGVAGPGSYYLFVYLCFYLFLPVSWLVFKRFSPITILLGGIAIAILLDYASFLLLDFLPANTRTIAYRFLPFKFFILAPLGYVIRTADLNSIKWKSLFLILGLVSFALLTLALLMPDFRPFQFGCDYGWRTGHWELYFYPTLIVVMMLLSRSYVPFFAKIGNLSWYVFLAQMVVFACFES